MRQNKKDYFLLLRKSTTFSYIIAIFFSAGAVFRHAHIYDLAPGFTLMAFTMKVFFLTFLFLVALFFLFFLFSSNKKIKEDFNFSFGMLSNKKQ